MEKLIIKGNSKPQYQFLEGCIHNDQTLYGGAAGPGKTWCDVILPIYHGFVNVPGFRMQIFRETEDELEDNIVPECHKYYPHAGGVYSSQKKIWLFPSGARVRLCYMSRPGAWRRYGGGNNTVQAFDEAAKIHPDNYTVETWNRSDCGIKPFRVYTTNPGGISHMKLKKEFVDLCPAIPDGPMKWSDLAQMMWQPVVASPAVYVEIVSDGATKKVRRQFIPARVFDNEDLLRNNPGYLANLLDKSPDQRRMMLEGDWNLIVGQMFHSFRGDIHLINFGDVLDRIQPDWKIIGSIDYGTNTTVFSLLLMDRQGNIYVIGELTHHDIAREVKARETKKYIEDFIETWGSKSQLIASLKKGDKLMLDVVGDTDMFMKLKDVPNLDSAAAIYRDYGIDLRMVSKAAPQGTLFRKWQVDIMNNLLDWKKDANGLFLKRPKIYFCADRCPKICETLPALQKDPLNPDVIDEREPKIDHWFRAVIYGVINLFKPPDRSQAKKVEEEIMRRIRDSV